MLSLHLGGKNTPPRHPHTSHWLPSHLLILHNIQQLQKLLLELPLPFPIICPRRLCQLTIELIHIPPQLLHKSPIRVHTIALSLHKSQRAVNRVEDVELPGSGVDVFEEVGVVFEEVGDSYGGAAGDAGVAVD